MENNKEGVLASQASTFNFLGLSKELRNKVYREFLLIDRWRIQVCVHTGSSWWGLETALLFVNRQLHQEAKVVLYHENCWIVLRTDSISEIDLGHDLGLNSYRIAHPARRDLAAIDPCFAPGIELRVEKRSALTELKTQAMVLTWAHMPHVCRLLTTRPSSFERKVTITLTGAKDFRRFMLDCLHEVHGQGTVKLEGFKITELEDLVVRMEHPFTGSTIYERLEAYRGKRLKYLKGDDKHCARSSMLEELEFLDGVVDRHWWTRVDHDRLLTVPEAAIVQYREAKVRVAMQIAATSLELNDPGFAKAIIVRSTVPTALFKSRGTLSNVIPSGLTAAQTANAHRYLGDAYIALGRDNAAAYSYLEALMVNPGFAEVDKALDEMESRLQKKMDANGITAWYNITTILHYLRHRANTERNILTEYEISRNRLFFIGSTAEIQSLHCAGKLPVSTALSSSYKAYANLGSAC